MQYLCTISTHAMDYIDAATSGMLLPHVLPVADLREMLQHIVDTFPLLYTYQYHQWTPCISTGTYVHMSSLKTNSSYY